MIYLIKIYFIFFLLSLNFINSMQEKLTQEKLTQEKVTLTYPSGKKYFIEEDILSESLVLSKYLEFIKDNNQNLDLDLSQINLSLIDKDLPDSALDNLFNLIKEFKYSPKSKIGIIFQAFLNDKIDLNSRLCTINLIEFLSVDKFIVPSAGALAFFLSKYKYLKKLRYSDNFFKKILALNAPYIKMIAGIALLEDEYSKSFKLNKLLNKLINKINLDKYKYSPKVQSISKDNRLFISDNSKSINLFKLNSNKLDFINKISFESKIITVSFNKDHNIMIVSLRNSLVCIFKLENNIFKKIFKINLKDNVNLIKIDDNNRYFVAISDRNLYFISLESKSIFFNIDLEYFELKNKNSKFCKFLDFIKDEHIVILLSSGELINIFINNKFLNIYQENLDFKDIEFAVLNANKKILAVYSKVNKIRIYDLVEKKILKEFKPPSKILNLFFSPDKTEFSYILVLCCDGSLFLFDIYTNQFLFILKPKKSPINNCVICDDGSSFLYSISSGVVQKVDIKNFRDFIFNNNYFFEHMLLLLSIFNKEKFCLKFEKDHIKELFNTLPEPLKLNFSNNF